MRSVETDSTERLLEHPAARRARELFEEWDERTMELQVELTEIPAPPFAEEARAARMAELLASAGLTGVRIDGVGNVRARLPSGHSDDPRKRIVLSAHLDTVFPRGTEVAVRRADDRWIGPGISDDGRGLAALVTLARAFVHLDTPLAKRIDFVATVGEEGAGDLRGVRHLFDDSTGTAGHAGGRGSDAVEAPDQGAAGRAAAPGEAVTGPASEVEAGKAPLDASGPVAGFISLDGAGLGRIVTRGLGVRRLRLAVTGPGGHSWVDRDAPNPIHALARAVSSLTDSDLPINPPVGLTISRWGGGSSINAVPGEAWVELDLRSESGNYLRDVEDRIRRLAAGAVAAANATASAGGAGDGRHLRLEVEVVGDRPPGSTNPESELVRAAVEATRAVGQEPELVASSTDSNIPMSRGVPAITMGAGGEAGGAHTPEEWFRNRNGPRGILRAFLTVLLASGTRDERR